MRRSHLVDRRARREVRSLRQTHAAHEGWRHAAVSAARIAGPLQRDVVVQAADDGDAIAELGERLERQRQRHSRPTVFGTQ